MASYDPQLQTTNQLQHSQYFAFLLNEEEYGIDILKVVEIRGLEHLTLVPSAPDFIKGVINLRGEIIPVMDLRERFGMPVAPYNRSTVLIILQTNNQEKNKNIGIIVDAVVDVYSINTADIQPKPEICNTQAHDYIQGLVTIYADNKETKETHQDKVIILLDVDQLLSMEIT